MDIECRSLDEYHQFFDLVSGLICLAPTYLLTSLLNSMVAAAAFKPYYPAVVKSTLIKERLPVHTFAGLVPDQFQQQATGFAGVFNGVNQMVCKSKSILYDAHENVC